jgi:hypothetical protein
MIQTSGPLDVTGKGEERKLDEGNPGCSGRQEEWKEDSVDRDKNDDWESDDVSGVNKPVHSNYI